MGMYYSVSLGRMVDEKEKPFQPVADPSGGLTPYQQYNIKQTEQADLDQKAKEKTSIDAYVKDVSEGRMSEEKISGIEDKLEGSVRAELQAKGVVPQTQVELDQKTLAKTMREKAQVVADVIKQIEEGKVTGQAAQDLLNSVATEFNTWAFTIGGKSLQGKEAAILSGNLILQEGEWKPGLLTGVLNPGGYRTPPPTGKVVDEIETVKNKMQNILSGYAPGDEGYRVTAAKQKEGPSIPGFLQNVKGDINENIQGVTGFIKTVMEQGQDPLLPVKMAWNMGKGYLGRLNEIAGKPFEGGDVAGRIGQNLYENPVNTALDVLPLFSLLKGGAKPSVKSGGLIEDAAGRAATQIGVTNPESVLRSENIMGQAIQNTKALTKRGMAKDLERSVSDLGKTIDDAVVGLDKKVPPQPVDEIVAQVEQRIAQTSAGQSNPDLVRKVTDVVKEQIAKGPLAEGVSRGEYMATDFQAMNRTRKYLNSGLDSWFKADKPVDSPTNNYNALRWEASQVLKDIISESDTAGVVKDSLNKQHVAMSASPVLAKESMSPVGAGGQFRTAVQMGGKVTEPIKIAGARYLQTLLNKPSQGASPMPDQLLRYLSLGRYNAQGQNY